MPSIISAFLTGALLASAVSAVNAQFRCGYYRPFKQDVERTTANIDTKKFLDRVRDEFNGKFKGYAVILTGSAGKRLGFRREGWAVDPCDDGSPKGFDLNTESSIGSVTKLFTTAAVLKATPKKKAYRLEDMPLTQYLPFRWRSLAHPFYDTVTIEMLLQHKGGFNRSGGGKHITERLAKGRERSYENYSQEPRAYSNTSMGIFHFLFAKFGFKSTSFLNPKSLHDVEVQYQNSDLDTYNEQVQKVTSAAFNHGLYKHIFKPLQISATCDPQVSSFPPSNSIKVPPNAPIQHFPFYTPAKSYASPTDSKGELLPSNMQNCASGGLRMSAKDLAKFAYSLGDNDFLSEDDQNRMMNSGPADDLYGFGVIGAEGGRAFCHTGKYNGKNGHASIAVLIRFASGASAVFLANSPSDDVNVLGTLPDAYNVART